MPCLATRTLDDEIRVQRSPSVGWLSKLALGWVPFPGVVARIKVGVRWGKDKEVYPGVHMPHCGPFSPVVPR